MDFPRNGDADNTKEILAAQAHIWNHVHRFVNSMSLKCAIQLGIPDIIHKHGHPMTLHQLIHALPINTSKSQFIGRVMRILTHSGFFHKEKMIGDGKNDEEEVGYALTPSSKLLLKDNPSSFTPFLLAMLDPLLTDPWHDLSRWFQDSCSTPFETCHGRAFWELAGREPRMNKFVNEAMSSDSHLVSSLVIRNCRSLFMGLKSMVDVGGGTGTLAKAMADAFPPLKCTVLDLPHVVDGLKNSENLAYVGGDMFEAIPPADAVFLKGILHDWSDEECVRILKKCKEAIPSRENGGKVIILDMVIMKEDQHNKGDHSSHEAIETQLFFDIQMMVQVTGKERTEEEWAKLFFEVGFNDYKITPALGLRSLIEVYY